MKTRRNVSKWPNFFDKSQQDELTGLWLRARFDIVLLHLHQLKSQLNRTEEAHSSQGGERDSATADDGGE